MAISEKDTKKLWGLSAGRCSYPGCPNDCIPALDIDETVVVGEMAHVVAKHPGGPRGIIEGGPNSYENLILLCPYHHTMIDKAPNSFPVETIRSWKGAHELRVRKAFLEITFQEKHSLFEFISKLLIENRSIWKTVGPESAEAVANPYSNLAKMWQQKKLDTIIPNNSRIVLALQTNKEMLSSQEFRIAAEFITHATAFEYSSFTRTEGVPRFPKGFEEMINGQP